MLHRYRTAAHVVTMLAVAAMPSRLFAQGTIVTLAGTGASGGCPAFDAPAGGSTFFVDPVSFPGGVAVDASGRLFVSMTTNCVMRLDADGLLRIGFPDSQPFRIGSGSPGFVDGDAATAQLSNPQKLALDAAGNLYIADASNHRIRRVDTVHWTITTIAGGGSLRPIDGILATDASFLFPTGVAVDATGNVYVSDTNAQKVFKVDVHGVLTTVAGSGGSTYNGDNIPAISAGMIPMGIDVDRFGDLFIADWSNSIVRKVTPDGMITTVAGNPFNVTGLGDGGPAAFGGILIKPRGVAVDSSGNLFIADTEHHRIRMVDGVGVISTVAGNGTPGSSDHQLNFPTAVAADDLGNIFIADTSNNELRAVVVSPRTYQMTLQSSGTGSGVVTGGGTYNVGQVVSVSALPNVGSSFAGWSGANAAACASGFVVMDVDKSCTATFDSVPDTTAPTLSGVPGPLTVTATGATGAIVAFALPTATDPDDAAGPVTCTPSSGSLFAVGTTTVRCTSTDTHGNTGFATFTVTVNPLPAAVPVSVTEVVHVADAPVILTSALISIAETISLVDVATVVPSDTTPPVIVLPTSIVTAATSPAGATVTFVVTANDAVSGAATVACVPQSGSTFPIGRTTVSCSASDHSGNMATGTFMVTVLSPGQLLATLIADVTGGQLHQAVQLLQQVIASLLRANTSAACGQLGAFINQMQAQSGKSIPTPRANALIAEGTSIRAALGCR